MKDVTGIVLGSGLGPLADALAVERRVGFAAAGLPESTVPGHAGEFLFGSLAGRPVVLMKGRVHLYEGHPPQVVTAGVRWLAEQGVSRLILTNAAGSLDTAHKPGSWLMVSDHLNLTGSSPLEGASFVDLSAAYDSAWRGSFRDGASALGITMHEGIYAGLRGPQYETPAEVWMLKTLGADAVGMSTVLETIQARALGLKVCAFSCLTNWAAGISGDPLDHQEVLATGREAAGDMIRLLEHCLGRGD